MRILHTVEFYSPSVGGAQEVVRQISERLVARGHEVTVATTRLAERRDRLPGGVRIEEFDISGNAVRGYRGETGRYQQFLQDSRFDVMLNYAAQQWTADLAFPVLERMAARKVLAPCGFSGLLSRDYEGYFAELPSALRRYDHLVFHGEAYRDAEFAKRHGLLRSTVIPNGAAEEEFGAPDPGFRARHGIPEGVPLILTVGSHTGAKGHGLIMRALRRARMERSVLAIIGNVIGGRGCVRSCRWRARWVRLASLGRKRVLLLDPPRQEVVAAYHAADIFAFGSNVECSPIVLFEAMASRTPFVTAAVGNAEEIARWSGGGIVLPTDQRSDGSVVADATVMARVLEDLVARPEERERLGEAGHRAWRERFTWDKIAGSYEALYRALVEQKSTPCALLRKSGATLTSPRVTVLMSVYNAEEYLASSIESILHQSFTDFECLIIDDGSQDRSKEIIEAFRDPRIRLISRENRGLTASLNEGIQEAKGEYIARQDADDASLPERLEREVVFLDSHPEVGMVGTNYIIIDEEGNRLDQSHLFTRPDDLAIAELLSNQFGHGSVMMRRSVLDQVGPYDPAVGIVEDYDLFCRISRVSKLANLREPLYAWRRTGGGVSLSNQKLQIKQAFAVRDREFKEQILKDRRRYRILTSIHPLSVPPSPICYLDKKSAVLRGLAWLYRAEGRRSESVRMMAAALLFAPWRKRNWRYLLRILVDSSKKSLWEYEIF